MSPSPLRELANHLRTSDDDVLLFGECNRFSMKELVVSRNYEDFATDFCDFVEAVKKNESITTLHFTFLLDSSEWRHGFWLFNTLCMHLPNARTLRIVQDFLHSVTMEDFALLLRGTDRFEEISLDYDVSLRMRSSFSFEWSWLKENSRLQSLEVPVDCCTASWVSMAEALLPLCNLERVIFHCCKVPGDDISNPARTRDSVGAIAAFLRLSSLRAVTLSGPTFINEAVVTAFAQGLSSSFIQDLTVLRPTFINEALLAAFAQGLSASSIQDLTVELDDDGTAVMERIFEGVVNCSNLRKVSVPGYFIRPTIAQDPVFPLTRLLRSNQEMTSLRLGCFEMRKEDLQALASVLRNGTRPLTSLCLGGLLRQEDLCLLLAAVKESNHLQTLELKHQLSSPDWQVIHSHLEALCKAPCLRYLSIRSAYGFDPTRETSSTELCRQLAERFSRNFVIESVFVDWLDADSRRKLDTMCELNKAGRRYLLSPNPSKADGVEVLSKHEDLFSFNSKAELDFLYTHLRENPSLCARDCDDHCGQDDSKTMPGARRKGTKRPFEDAQMSTNE